MPQELDHFRIFYYVASQGSMNRAAVELGMTPPTVSRIIQSLETRLSCQLFLRTRQGIILTPEGESLFNRVAPAFRMIETGEKYLEQRRTNLSGTVSISATRIAAEQFLIPRCLPPIQTSHPEIRIRISLTPHAEIERSILAGFSDFAVTNAFDSQAGKCVFQPLFSNSNVAIVGKRYENLAFRPVSIQELSKIPLIFVSSENSIRIHYQKFFRRNNLDCVPAIEVTNVTEQVAAVQAGLGYSFVPISAALNPSYANNLFIVQTAMVHPLPLVECLLTAKNVPLTLAAQFCANTIIRCAEILQLEINRHTDIDLQHNSLMDDSLLLTEKQNPSDEKR